MKVKGTAMGCPYAPEMAVLFMALFEDKFIFNQNPYSQNVISWYRYIDDIWCLWEGTNEQLSHFFEWLNNRHADIKFSMTKNKSHLTFLDVEVLVQDHQLITTLHWKPTDKNTILHYRSFHPKSLKDNLPYSQLLRI